MASTLRHGCIGRSFVDFGTQANALDGYGADAAILLRQVSYRQVGPVRDLNGSARDDAGVAEVRLRIHSCAGAAADTVLDTTPEVRIIQRGFQELLAEAVLQFRNIEVDLILSAVVVTGVVQFLIVGAFVVFGVRIGLECIISCIC